MKTLTTWQDFDGEAGAAVTTWNYNDAGALVSKRYPDNTGPDYAYDARGLLINRKWARTSAVAAGNRLETVYTYNSHGELTNIDYPESDTPSVVNTYDRQGHLTSVQDASGTREYTYEDFQLVREEYIAGLLNGWKIEREQDNLLRPESVDLQYANVSLHKTTYGYQSDISRLETVTGHGITNTYAYQPNRNLLSTLDQGGVQGVSYTHDVMNRLTQIETTVDTSVISSHAYQYNQANQRILADLADGSYWEYSYDDLGQVTGGVKKDSLGTPIPGYTFGYTFDDIGNRKTFTENIRTTSYTANLLNQYTGIIRPPFAHLRGERSHLNIAIDVNEQPVTQFTGLLWYKELPVSDLVSSINILSTNTQTQGKFSLSGALTTPSGLNVPEFDEDGNLTRDHLWEYTWNSENRLVRQEHRTDVIISPLTRTKLEFVYDSQGRRVRKTVSRWDAQTETYALEDDLRFIYDGWNLIAEIKSDDALLRTHVWGLDLSRSMQGAGGVGGLLSTRHHGAATITALPFFDGNGNVMGYTDSATESLVATYEFDPFGRRIRTNGSSANHFAFRFSTKYECEDSGFLYYGYRSYDPEIGRWLSLDPIEEDGGYNLYAFVDNNPTGNYDLFGLSSKQSNCPNKKNCGPDVTQSVENTLRDIRSWYDRLDMGEKHTACMGLVGMDTTGRIPRFNLSLFDIFPLYRIGNGASAKSYLRPSGSLVDGSGDGCEYTVVFQNKCHNAGHLNYIMWGAINQRCNKSFGIRRLGIHAGMHGLWSRRYAVAMAVGWKMAQKNYNSDTLRAVSSITLCGYQNSGTRSPWNSNEHRKCDILEGNTDKSGLFLWRWEPLQP